MRHFIIILIIQFIILSCVKNDNDEQDDNYPTIINKLSSNAIYEARETYFHQNKYIVSTLNQFGFCDFGDSIRTADSPPLLSSITKSEAISIVDNFITKNSTYIGIKSLSDLTFTSIDSSSGTYWDGAKYWFLTSSNQKIDTLEVINSQIIFHIKNRELIRCAGNWFNDVYIPKKFKINISTAKTILLNKVFYHYTFSGQKYDVTTSKESLDASKYKLVIYPVKSPDKIELRVAWQINIPGPVFYIVFVDVMTGEIIGKQPTIIS